MLRKRNRFLGHFYATSLLCFMFATVQAQLIGKPQLFFSDVCPVVGSEIEYELAFEIDPTRFSNNNTFSVELSDADGVFLVDLVEVLTTVSGSNNESVVYVRFKFGEPLYGDNYKIRIESSSPTAISIPSEAFSGYTIANEQLILNNDEDVELSSSKTAISVLVNGDDNFKYHWFKDGNFYAETDGVELEITEPGLYYVSTFYGDCTGLDFSNVINVTQAQPKRIQTIVSPNGDSYNDYWELPKEYANNKDIRVTILNQNGTILLDTNSYDNKWPLNNGGSLKGAGNVVFYIIQDKRKLLHKGAVTIAQ